MTLMAVRITLYIKQYVKRQRLKNNVGCLQVASCNKGNHDLI